MCFCVVLCGDVYCVAGCVCVFTPPSSFSLSIRAEAQLSSFRSFHLLSSSSSSTILLTVTPPLLSLHAPVRRPFLIRSERSLSSLSRAARHRWQPCAHAVWPCSMPVCLSQRKCVDCGVVGVVWWVWCGVVWCDLFNRNPINHVPFHSVRSLIIIINNHLPSSSTTTSHQHTRTHLISPRSQLCGWSGDGVDSGREGRRRAR